MVTREQAGSSPRSDHLMEPIAVRIPEACRMIGIGRSKLYEMIGVGAIQVVKIGRATVIPVAELKNLIQPVVD